MSSRSASLLAALLATALGGPAFSQTPPGTSAEAPAPAPAPEAPAPAASPPPTSGVIAPPQPLEMPTIPLPADAPEFTAPVDVTVVLTIDAKGDVTAVDVTGSGGKAFDEAVIAGAKKFRFKPATQDGVPIEVRVPFTQTFVPPPKPLKPAEPDLDAVLEGIVVDRGTRTPVPNATVAASDADGHDYLTTTDPKGLFALPVRSGRQLAIRIVAAEHENFSQRESLAPNEKLKVKYLIDRKSYGQYESIVRADRDRTEVSRTTLSGRELTRVPGTFGDPFRVINVLPGVTSVMSLLPLPVVRGSSPGNTGIFIDGVRLPLLFHLFGGPSVVHPELIDHVDFYPGGFPVTYGGYTGGIVDGLTRQARKDEQRIDLDVNLAQAGGMVRQPLESLGGTATLAARTGYPGLLLSLLVPTVSLGYWDYQARFDGGKGLHSWSVFTFGAQDVLKTRATPDAELKTAARFTFHRLDLRYRYGDDDNFELARVVFGYDDSLLGGFGGGGGPGNVSGDSGIGTGSWSVDPQVRLHRTLVPWLQLNAGAEANVRTVKTPEDANTPNATNLLGQASQVVNQDGYFTVAGVFTEGVFKLGQRLVLIPGVRGDVYDQRKQPKGVTQWSVDPRFMARFRVTDGDDFGTTLKGVVGRYHQPPRLFVPVPGLDESSLDLGLLASTQYSVGAETKLGPSGELDVNVYYNDMNPVLFDLSVNPDAANIQQPQPQYYPWELPPPSQGNTNSTIAALFQKRPGRSYGFELLLRRRDAERLFGWVSYTLSHSERQNVDGTWQTFDFDRLHILNFVAGVRLPRNWEFGTRVLFQTGTPLTTIFGTNVTRSDNQFRVDLRIDKRAVWNQWMLDFYVDVINTTVAEESGGLVGGAPVRYLIPTVGVRGVL